jgi:hypothetical protein
MSNYTVTCPKCQHSFEPTDAIREEVEKELRGKMTDWQKKKEEETNQLLAEQKTKLQTEITEQLKKNIASDYEHKIKLMQENETKMQQQANEYREKELDFLKKLQDIQTKEAELELNAAKLDVEVAKKAFYPSLNITSSLGIQAFRADYLITQPQTTLHVCQKN